MSDAKVIDLFTPSLPHGGTFYNIIDKPRTSEQMMAELYDAVTKIRRLQMHVVPDERFVLPHNWETSLHPLLVAEIRRRLGR